MTNKVKVAISSDFLTAFAKLPRKVQGKVTEFINKFRNNPLATGIKYEKIKQALDDKIYSVRIDDTYRGIVVRQEKTGVYLLLWVDHHDEAYAWASKKKCVINPISGAIQVYDMQEISVEVAADTRPKLFAALGDGELLELGLPQEQVPLVRSLHDKEEFYAVKSSLPLDVFEALSWIAEGFPFDEVKEMLEAETIAAGEQDDLAVALDKPNNMKSFVVIEGEEDLRAIMAEPLEKWRVFLHPTQRKIVRKEYHGAARVLGGAGTGKTVVAMHRAKYLASRLEPGKRILFTTFTANLAADIKENLQKICTTEEMRKIDIVNFDAWVAGFLKDKGYSSKIMYGAEVTKTWQTALLNANVDLEYPVSFYEEEWNRIVVPQEAFTLEGYAKAKRTGRGTRLDRKKRFAIWKVINTYITLMKEEQQKDVNMAMYECRTLFNQLPNINTYKHIIVDEGQDFSYSAYKLLRTLAGEEHANDLFIVGDSHQRIYKNKVVLSQCGINVRGRSSLLKINYRTTEEIRKAAFSVLQGISFDDLDGDVDLGDKCQSLTHGEKPHIFEFKDASTEFDFIKAEIDKLVAAGVGLSDICIVARTHKLVDSYTQLLENCDLRVFEIRQNKSDNRHIEGLRVATMHRVKGLEFKYVFIVAANDRILPLNMAIDHTDAVAEDESMTAEKSLLYVAMTRAQQGVYITSYGKKSPFLK